MATYGDLKTRIASELVRDDLAIGEEGEHHTITAIGAAINYYKGQNLWFLRTRQTAATVASQDYITRPTTIERITRIAVPSLGIDLDKEDWEELEREDEPTAQTGQPISYAEAEGGTQLRIWPTPNAVYALKIMGTRRIPDMASDGDTTVWTNEAYDLIAARAKVELARFPLRDPDAEAAASREEARALQAINETNTDRFDMPVCPGW